MSARKRKLTDADKRAAEKVRQLWADYKKKNPGVSQETAAGLAGFTQSAFSQFVLGVVPIRVSPALKFAKLFGVSPTEIRADLAEIAYATSGAAKQHAAREPAPGDLSSDALSIARIYEDLEPVTKDRFRDLLIMFSVIDRHYSWVHKRPKGPSYFELQRRAVARDVEHVAVLKPRRAAKA